MYSIKKISTCLLLLLSGGLLLVAGCTKDTQNRLGRAVRNWTGNHGVLDIYAGDKLVKRFIHIEKLTTARATATP